MKPHSTTETTIKLNGQLVPVYVRIYCEQSDLSLDDVIGDAEDRVKLERMVSRGDLDICDITVSVSALGIDGSDHLGGCYVSSPKCPQRIVNDNDMLANALNDLTDNIKKTYETLKPYFAA